MTRPLYSITSDLLALNDLLDEVEGDLSRCGEMEGAVTAWLTSLEAEQATKLDSFVGLVRTLEMEATAARAEKDQWAAKEAARTARVTYLKSRLKAHLELTGQAKVYTAKGHAISVQRNGGATPLEIKPGTDATEVPPRFAKVEVTIDKAKVREALERGEAVEFAELLPRGTHLRIA